MRCVGSPLFLKCPKSFRAMAVCVLTVLLSALCVGGLCACGGGAGVKAADSSGSDPADNRGSETYSWDILSWSELSELSQSLADAQTNEERAEIALQAGIVDDEGHLTNTVRRIDLTNGYSLDVRIIGICHDTREDGTTVGLTLMATGAIDRSAMNQGDTVEGGWEQSSLRARLEGELLDLFPDDVRTYMVPVAKLTNNRGNNDDTSSVTTTVDTLWLPSVHEVCGDVAWEEREYGDTWLGIDATLNAEGEQYQYFAELGVNPNDANPGLTLDATSGKSGWWLRTPFPQLERTNGEGAYFCCVSDVGNPESYQAPSQISAVVVCFCI